MVTGRWFAASALGLSATTYGPSYVDLDDLPMFMIFGPDRSGRSSTLASLTEGTRAVAPNIESYLLAPRRSPLRELTGWTRAATGFDECDELAVDLADLVRERRPRRRGAVPRRDR